MDAQHIRDRLKTLPVDGAVAMTADGSNVSLSLAGMRWSQSFRSDTQQGPTPKKTTDVVHKEGQQIWVRQMDDGWWLAQVPDVNSALVSLDPQNGSVKALVGGFDFNQSKFNRISQALRQVGSNTKPLFVYQPRWIKG